MTRVMTVVSMKGGVLKTTNSANIAAVLARKGQRVLAIDLDPSGDLSESLGMRTHRQPFVEFADLIVTDEDEDARGLEHCMTPCLLPQTEDRLWGVPAHVRLEQAEIALAQRPHLQIRLQQLIQRLNGEWDWVIIDTPARAGSLAWIAALAADEAIICTDTTVLGYRNLGKMTRTLKSVDAMRRDRPIHIHGVLLGLVDTRTRLAREFVDWLDSDAHKLVPTQIPKAVSAAEAPAMNVPVALSRPDQKVSIRYYELVDWLTKNHPTTQPAKPETAAA